MSLEPSPDRLQLPETLRHQLDDYRRRVWTIKTIEAASAAGFGVVMAFLLMFALDRVWETPGWPRAGLFGLVLLAGSTVPIAIHRWVWRRRHPEQLARLLARKHPRIGDQLLGVIELARDDSEQARSRRLVEAAIEQVALDSAKRDFRDAVPHPRHRLWLGIFAIPAMVGLGLFLGCPAAASNAWARLVAPWSHTPRYTFAALEPLPGRIVVAHGEPFSFEVTLDRATAWHPVQATARIGERPPVTARLNNGGYRFELPSQVNPTRVEIRVGDASRSVEVEPTLRPELTSVVADLTLPDYLGRPGSQRKDVRGGSIALVKGSRATFTATAGRDLASSTVDGTTQTLQGPTFSSLPILVDGSRDLPMTWSDRFGLAGKEPFTLKIASREDEAPSLTIEGLPRQKVLIDSELLRFKIHAQDDFGVRRVGLEWRGLDPKAVPSIAMGERVLAPGGQDRESLEVDGSFSARSMGIEPQPIALHVWVEDYLPGRPRVVSPAYTLFILSAADHAIWLTEQLSKWHRQSLEVRDREMQLHEANKAIRELSADEMDQPETRKKIDAQASSERANGRRLSGLVTSGEDLVKQAMRNPEFGVGHLERWAEMLQILKNISGERMPSVADLLKQAAQAPTGLASKPASSGPKAGNDRSSGATKPSEPPPGPSRPPTSVPSVVDRESSQQPADKKEEPPGPGSAPKPSRLLLPKTELAGGVKSAPPGDPPAAQKVDEALTQQRDLLAEFDKVADELNRVLANLEGSTLVKRLKAASRSQLTIGGKLVAEVPNAFGLTRANAAPPSLEQFRALADQEAQASQTVSTIMDDMAAYFERRRFLRFKTVLDEMRQKDTIGSLRLLGDDLRKEPGLSIAQCEFWSDTLDRWADDLVDPATSGACPGSKAKGSLPPSVVLEVMQILEGEVNLREETRVAQQARPALTTEEFGKQATGLSRTQGGLQTRVVKVTDRIKELPDSAQEFGDEIAMLGQVAEVMEEATAILAGPETGSTAIAAETEAIELLLQSKRINPKGGGGGGSSPGGGGRGTTQDSALALIGQGLNQKEVREDRGTSQATGDSGPALPEEFRTGLDQYFNKLDRKPAGR